MAIVDREALEAELVEQRAKVDLQRVKLRVESQKLEALESILASVKVLAGEPADDGDNGPVRFRKMSGQEFTRLVESGAHTVGQLSGSGQLTVTVPNDSPSRLKTPSTQRVVQLVEESIFGLSREQVHEGYASHFGIPATWTNPTNAINTALQRAVERKLIDANADGTLFAPRGSLFKAGGDS